MTDTLVDTNVLLDVADDGSEWWAWSSEALREAADSGSTVINQVIFAELSAGYATAEELDTTFAPDRFRRESIPWEAAFLAGKAYLAYRRAGGIRTAPLPDFFIGAHAAVRGYRLLTRDPDTYARYFPTIDIVSPGGPR
ncbi:MAG: type II toxin-antitoxin system VapC family toxin [Bauldia sp.]